MCVNARDKCVLEYFAILYYSMLMADNELDNGTCNGPVLDNGTRNG